MKRRKFIKTGMLASVGGASIGADWLSEHRDLLLRDKIPIIDTHVHLWDLQKLDYPWLENKDSPLSKNFLVPDFQLAAKDCNINKIIFVECGRLESQYLQEVDWVVDQAILEPRIKGMVAYLPISKGEAAIPEIEELIKRDIVKGIRHGVNKELVTNSRFINGIQLLPQYDLSFDLNLSPSLINVAIDLIEKCPKTTFILNHLCNPNIKDKELKAWKAGMSRLAEMDNVYCKISGIITKADHQDWNNEDLRPYVDHALRIFGPDRVLFGGDWPVVLLAGDYHDWYLSFQEITKDLSRQEKEQLYYRNAERVYRV